MGIIKIKNKTEHDSIFILFISLKGSLMFLHQPLLLQQTIYLMGQYDKLLNNPYATILSYNHQQSKKENLRLYLHLVNMDQNQCLLNQQSLMAT